MERATAYESDLDNHGEIHVKRRGQQQDTEVLHYAQLAYMTMPARRIFETRIGGTQ
jgi:hypothetical protein